MIPRIRPFFHKDYIDSVKRFEPSLNRERYLHEISRKLENYYPNAKAFEFINFGRNSLSLGLSILDLKENDEILIPCFTCSTILNPILCNKIKPILYDIELNFNINIDRLKEKITSKTKAILVTHYFGIPSNIREIKEFADLQGIHLIEDCAHSICSNLDGIVLGSIGDFSFTSFGNDKPLSVGSGSMLILNNKDYLDKFYESIPQVNLNEIYLEKCYFLSLLFFYLNTERSVYHQFIGTHHFYDYFSSQCSEVENIYQDLHEIDPNLSILSQEFLALSVQYPKHKPKILKKFLDKIICNSSFNKIAASKRMNSFSLNILQTGIDHIDEINAFRRKIGSYYTEKLIQNNKIIITTDHNEIPFLRYSIINKNPTETAKIIKNLKSSGYECGNFNWGTSLNTILKVNKKFENSEFLAKNIINLPCHLSMNESDVSDICGIINRI